MTTRKKPQGILVFTISHTQDGPYTIARANEVPVNAPGRTKHEATVELELALRMYVDGLRDRGELQEAITKFGIRGWNLGDRTRDPWRPFLAWDAPEEAGACSGMLVPA